MTRQDTQILKGLAILMMLFLHLFNEVQKANLCVNFIHVADKPLTFIMTRMANPVPLFVMLSGYGLYAVSLKGDKNRWTRLWRLVKRYWLILAIFVTIGHFLVPQTYPGSFANIIKNLTAYETSYNGEHWFLFPYILLAVTSPWLFRICNRYNTIVVLGVSYFIYLATCYLIKFYGPTYLFTHMAPYHPILYGSLLFNFILGALACKNHWLEKSKKPIVTRFAWVTILLLCVLRCCMSTTAFHNLFIFALMWLWIQTTRPAKIDRVLHHLGDHSMNIWLIHTFFCTYLFHDFIYGFKYPLLIYLVLIAVSYLSSCVINWIDNKMTHYFAK